MKYMDKAKAKGRAGFHGAYSGMGKAAADEKVKEWAEGEEKAAEEKTASEQSPPKDTKAGEEKTAEETKEASEKPLSLGAEMAKAAVMAKEASSCKGSKYLPRREPKKK